MDLMSLLVLLAAVSQGTAAASPPAAVPARAALEARLASAKKECREHPASVAALDRLAAVQLREYRYTHAAETIGSAQAAIDRAFALEPRDFDARRLRAAIRLTNHEFHEVERDCLELLMERPRNIDVLGMLADSRMEMGRYSEAVDTIQRMVDTRPGLPAYSRVSYAREIHGELSGALAAMDMAIAAGDASDPEALAWCLARSGLLAWKLGRLEEADSRNRAALALFPDCPYAHEGLGQIAAARGDLEAAARRFERAFSIVPWPQYAIERFEIALRQQDETEVTHWRSLVEALERLSTEGALFNRALTLFEADHGDPARAVRMGRAELAGRKDVYGWDAYAWALHRAGRPAEAAEAESHALELGTQDPLLQAHAAEIFAAWGTAASRTAR